MYMAYIGIAGVNSPRGAFKEAFAVGLINDSDNWIKMLQDRNLTTIPIMRNKQKPYITE